MTLAELEDVLSGVGIPVAYDVFREDTPPPRIHYIQLDTDDLSADSINYVTVRRMVAELYTNRKDLALEERLETALNDAGIFYRSEDESLTAENEYLRLYSFTIVE